MKTHATIYRCELRCGLRAQFVLLQIPPPGGWALQGVDAEGAIHLWKLTGQWSDAGEHPFDIIGQPVPLPNH